MIKLLFLSSGLFLGWSLGANDAANLFGTAVGSKMVKFKLAAFVISIFVILGAVLSGSGASHTLGKLGAISKLPGAFIVALSAAITVTLMTRKGLPVSTSQAIIGGILGWNIFGLKAIDFSTLTKIILTWIFSPILTAVFSILLYLLAKKVVKNIKINIFMRYYILRFLLIVIGAFGAYSLGANNIANVMGVFVGSITINNDLFLNNTQLLFLIGGVAISIGVFTYSKKVMSTVGEKLFKISPLTALIIVLSSSIVLFLFASSSLKMFLTSYNLPSFPLVPVSSSQAIIGGIIGVGIVKGQTNINKKKLLSIGLSWISTPLLAVLISLIGLFIMQNLFLLEVI